MEKIMSLLLILFTVLSSFSTCGTKDFVVEELSSSAPEASSEASIEEPSSEEPSEESSEESVRTNYALGKSYVIGGSAKYLGGKEDNGVILTDGNIPSVETEGSTVAFSGTNASNSITVDLSKIYTEINEIVVAGVVVNGNRQYGSVTIEASETGSYYTALSGYRESASVYSGNTNNYSYIFSSNVTARYIRITFVSSSYVLTVGDIMIYGGGAVKDPSEIPEDNRVIKYTQDKSGYLSNMKTNNLNFNSRTYKAKELSGSHFGTVIDSSGRLTLEMKDGVTTGYFESNVINVGKFSAMLISWNALCGNGQIQVTVSYEASGGAWSEYFSYGVWSDKNYTSTSKSASTSYGKMDIDTFTPYKTTTGNIKVRISFVRVGDHIPVVENITIATPEMRTASPAQYPSSAWVKVPMRSQLAPENGSDGGVMCSATTVAMALEYLGFMQTTYETAMGTWDNGFSGYGNWLFSVAEAGAHGYYAFCDFYTEDMLKYALSKGYSVGCSTYLTSAGHIVLVVGYETINGVDYYIVNDPNVSANNVRVSRYTCDYFNSVWFKGSFGNTGVVYVFQGQY